MQQKKNFETEIEVPLKRAEQYWHKLGPGLTTGASDDDPSGIATYSQTGARYGYRLLWLAWFTLPLMGVIQEMCARIGVVTGRGLAANIRHNYSKPVLYLTTALLFAANTFNIGADLGAMAKGAQLLNPQINFAGLVIFFAALSLLLQIFTSYVVYARYLKYLALVLFAYIISALLSGLNWREVFIHSVIPSIHFNKNELLIICGILGTTISPYLFFWQTSQEVEEQNLQGKEEDTWHQPVSSAQLSDLKADVWSGMFFSNVVMFFIIAACAGTLYAHGITNIATASDAAMALRPFGGNAAFWLFAVGIIGTGMLAIPVLAGSTSYALSESFGWKHGLYRKLKEAYAFYGVIVVSMVFGILMNFIGLDPIKALIYSAVANGVVAPIILVLIVKMSSSKEIMQGNENHKFVRWIGWLTVALMTVSGIAAIASFFL
ncbi:MAG: natural resistance-associated macrophage protein [Candidatus Doudnabacteria bacterium]|nr:natural resistance-associated macrophage protein [Candidatus Doudnabacteria bacterium]